MKTLLALAVVFLTGCSIILPKPHDPVMFDRVVAVQIKVSQINCSNKDWGNLFDQVHHLKVYTALRSDPQAPAVAQMEDALLKAYNSKNEKFCESILKLQQTRIAVIEDAWKGRK